MIENSKYTSAAYSIVTNTEGMHDRAVTLDKHEKDVISKIYKLDTIPRQTDTRTKFIVKGERGYTEQELLIKYPKSSGNEIRLYMSDSQEFSGDPGQVFFVAEDPQHKYPIVGFCNEEEIESLDKIIVENYEESTEFQIDTEETVSLLVKNKSVYEISHLPRSAREAAIAISSSNYKCQNNEEHDTFISRRSGKNFTEAHHLIPLKYQSNFDTNIDTRHNIVSLCPNCHRSIHHSDTSTKRQIIETLYNKKINNLNDIGIYIEIEQLHEMY
jgi:5-methylcytosine-specific restriction protein A